MWCTIQFGYFHLVCLAQVGTLRALLGGGYEVPPVMAEAGRVEGFRCFLSPLGRSFVCQIQAHSASDQTGREIRQLSAISLSEGRQIGPEARASCPPKDKPHFD